MCRRDAEGHALCSALPTHFTEQLSFAVCWQEELQQLKQSFKDVTLKKSTLSDSDTAPFPVTATVSFVAPPSASAYDVTGFKVKMLHEPTQDVEVDFHGKFVIAAFRPAESLDLMCLMI